MGGLHFVISADNTRFIKSVNEIKKSVDTTSRIINDLGKNFEISTVEDKIISLSKVIRNNHELIDRWSIRVKKWEKDADEAFNNNQFEALAAINGNIDEYKRKIAELTEETRQYTTVLSAVQASAGQDITARSISAPKFFASESDYQYAEKLKEKMAELQEQIASFNGSEEELSPLRRELSETTSQFLAVSTAAAQTAAALGGDLGGRAAEASVALYTMNQAVKDQCQTVEELKAKLAETSIELERLESNDGEAQAIEDTRIMFDNLTQSVANAEQQLAILSGMQADASAHWRQVSNEVEQHDSVMVKMFGGYENYQNVVGQLPQLLQRVIGSISGMTGAAKSFVATPLGACIAAIVIALKTLSTWFDSTVEGQMTFAKISGYASGILDQLKEIVIAVGKAIYSAFTDPRKAVEDLWSAVKSNLVNRFKSLGDMATDLGGLLKAALTFDTDGIKSQFTKLTNSFLQFGTGVENVTSKVGNFIKKTHEAAKTNATLSVEEKQLNIDESKMAKANSELAKEMGTLRTAMYSKDKKKAAEALKKYRELSERQMQNELSIQERKIALQEGKMALTSNSIEDENQLRALQTQKTQIEASHESRMAMLQRHANGLSIGKSADQIESQQKQASQKILDLMKNQAEERLRLQQEYEYQIWQNRIDLMDDGEAKTLEQTSLNNKKELDATEQQKQAAITAEIARQKAIFDAVEEEKAAKQKGYGKQIFNPLSDLSQGEITAITARYDSLHNQLIQKQEKAEQDRLIASQESMNAYLKEFGSYQEKRLAIAEEYETKIAEAQNDGERMMFTAQRDKALSDLDYSEWVDSGAIALAFGEIEKLSDRTIEKLISDMETYRDKVIATFDPEKIQKYEEALSGLRTLKIDNSFGALSSVIPDYFKQRKATADSKDSAEKNLNKLYEQRAQLLLRVSSLETAIHATKSAGGNTDGLQEELNGVNVQLKSNEDATRKAKNVFKQLQEEWDKLNTPEDKFYGLCSAIDTASGYVGGLASQAAEMCDALGADGMASALGTLGDAMNSVGNIASGFAQGGLIGGIAAAAGEVMGWVGKIFSAGDRKHEQNIERIQKQIDALNKSYEKLGQSAEEAFSTDASKLIEQQNTLLQQQKVLIRQQIAEEEAKKKTDNDKIQQYREQIEEIESLLADNKQKAKDAIVGEDVKSAINEFSSLYAGAWNDGTDAAQKSTQAIKSIVTSALNELLKKNIQPAVERFHNSLAEAMADGFLSDEELANLDVIKREIDTLAALSEDQFDKIQQRYKDLDELREELTDISFDSVRDNFKSKLADMKADSKDFKSDFSDMLRQGLIDGLMDTKYDAMLKEWYDEFAEAMNDRSLTDSERDKLRQKYEAIVNQGIQDRDFINDIVGGTSYSQEATKGWSTTMTQDQGDELNGRFTAMVELEAVNNILVSEGNAISASILATLQSLVTMSTVSSGDNATLLAIKDMMFLSTGFLEEIAKYAKTLSDISGGINSLNDLINKRL